MAVLRATLMRIFAVALDQPETFFDDRSTDTSAGCGCGTTPAPRPPPAPGQIRAGAHSDYGSLTLLKAAEDKPGGLQVCNAAGTGSMCRWSTSCFIVNLGDLLARWTNDAGSRTLHRVANPPRSWLA